MRRLGWRRNLEMLIGILGFFTAMAFIVAVVGIVRGDPGVTPSLVLLGCVVLLGLAWTVWRRTS